MLKGSKAKSKIQVLYTGIYCQGVKQSELSIYSETSIGRPLTGVYSCGRFWEVVDLQNFPKYGTDTILLFRFL